MSAREVETLQPAPAKLTTGRTFADVNRDVIRTLAFPGNLYFGWMSFVALVLAGGIFAWGMQIYYGMGMAGKRNPQMWAMYITTFVFWIGIGHAGTLISAILYLFRAKWRTSIYRGAEAMTIFAVMTAGLFPMIHLGRMWLPYWLIPYPNQRYLWPAFRSPLLWDVFAISTYFTISAVFFSSGWCRTPRLEPPPAGSSDLRDPRWLAGSDCSVATAYGLFAGCDPASCPSTAWCPSTLPWPWSPVGTRRSSLRSSWTGPSSRASPWCCS
jgi:hypothetical protein